jgi:hypothetical protein
MFSVLLTLRLQLAYLIHPRQNFLHGCYAGLELLLFGVSRVIIDIDFSVSGFFRDRSHKESCAFSCLVLLK